MNMITEIVEIFKKHFDKQISFVLEHNIRTDLIELLVEKQDIITMTREGREFVGDMVELLNRRVVIADSSPDTIVMPIRLRREIRKKDKRQ